ncbi:MAG: uridine kinase family protein [Candidatus Dependentiae bacterium]
MYKITIILILSLISSIKASEDNFEIICTPLLEQAKKLAQQHADNPTSSKPIIAIAGCSAVGKSYFTRKLSKLLRQQGVKVKILKADDFLQPTPVENPLIHKNFDHIKLHDTLSKIISGEEHIEKPIWDHAEKVSTKDTEVACFHNVNLILFEGIYCLCDSTSYDFLKYSSIRVFLDADDTDIIEWNWKRELRTPEKARTREKFDEDIKWDMEDYHKTIAPTKQYADFVIFKKNDHSYEIRQQPESDDKKSDNGPIDADIS